ncbi:MAG: DNA polymerase elongation subunit, family B [uncultured archaeon A07HR60]|nr:MAG: DNA polymerase elongation subunit, family B [uncultured archaeon A07HR60]
MERAGLPLEELGWASIGRVLTAMQIREAAARDVLVPWQAWRPEFFKQASTLDDADRGGTILAPEVGVHDDVHELDFASLYPNIIRTRNISPETVRCGCCDNDAVPGLGYSICESDGYLPDVLGPLIDARSEIKQQIPELTPDNESNWRLHPRRSSGSSFPVSAIRAFLTRSSVGSSVTSRSTPSPARSFSTRKPPSKTLAGVSCMGSSTRSG